MNSDALVGFLIVAFACIGLYIYAKLRWIGK